MGRVWWRSPTRTILAAFPKLCRFLADDAVLLIHQKRMDYSVTLNGPLKSCIQIVKEQLAMLEAAERLEMEGLGEFVEGSSLTIDELYARAAKNYYIHAEDALKDGLIAKILR